MTTTSSLPTDAPYETTDLGVVAYLLLLDVEPLSVQRRQGRGTFAFPASASKHAKRFYGDSEEGLVSARRYYECVQQAKRLLFLDGAR